MVKHKWYKHKYVVLLFHVFAWACLLLFPFIRYRIDIRDSSFFLKEAINTAFLIGLFYLNMYVLIPRFFTLKRIGIYIGCVLLLIVFITFQQAFVEYRFINSIMNRSHNVLVVSDEFGSTVPGIPPTPGHLRIKLKDTIYVNDSAMARNLPGLPALAWRRRLYRDWRNRQPSIVSFPTDSIGSTMITPAHPFRDNEFLQGFFIPTMFRKSALFALLILFMSGFIKIAMEWFKSEKQREALAIANLNAELKFLKSQINPHFLFNSLNTIYSLAHRKSPETEHALVKLSTILRYMIYQSNEDKVQLQNELGYLQHYIDLQRLRITKDIPVSFVVEGDPAGLEIAPMLLIPFVENAFKHGISYTASSFIDVKINIHNGVIHMLVRNSLFKQRMAEKGGVGLSNVLKRLELLYPGNHSIRIEEEKDEYVADLSITLTV